MRFSPRIISAFLLAISLLPVAPLSAQDSLRLAQPSTTSPSAAPAGPPAARTPPAAPAPAVPTPEITRIYNISRPDNDKEFDLGGTITLEVKYLAQRMSVDSLLLSRQPTAGRLTNDSLVLFIGQVPLPRLAPIRVDAVDRTTSTVTFTLDRNRYNKRYWELLYASPMDFAHSAKIGIGYRTKIFSTIYPLGDQQLELVRLKPYRFWLTVGFTLLLGGGIVALGRRSWMLRNDVDPQQFVPGSSIPQQDPPYSLAKMQLAWWTVLIVGGLSAHLRSDRRSPGGDRDNPGAAGPQRGHYHGQQVYRQPAGQHANHGQYAATGRAATLQGLAA
jgi:hypothetical protein